GNNGHAYLPLNYFEQKKFPQFLFFQPYIDYTTQTNELAFYDTRQPFALFQFTGGKNKYEDVLGLFTVNPTPFINVGLKYHSIKTDGNFIHSESKIKDFNFWQSYTKKRYQNYFSIIHNASNAQEFGGFKNDSVYESGQRIENIAVNLNSASSKTRHQEIKYTHEFHLGKMSYDTIKNETDTIINISHLGNWSLCQDLAFSRNWRLYTDNPEENFYNTILLDSTSTSDSIAKNNLSINTGVLYAMQKDSLFSVKIFGGVNHLFYKAHIANLDTLIQSHGLIAKATGKFKDYTFSANLNAGIIGRNQGDISMHLQAGYSPKSFKHNVFLFSVNTASSTPDFFYEHYSSNHFYWNQDLKKEHSIKTEANYLNQKWHLNVYLRHALINQMIYINENGVPAQHNGSINISNAGIGKTFYLRNFGLHTNVCYQYLSEQSAIRLPEILVKGGIFYENKIFNRNMTLRFGVDARYYNKYYSYAYIPATGFFAVQNQKKTGGTPLIDAYLNFKVKRFRAFLRYSNMGQSLFKVKTYSLLHYPERPSGFYFGISWEFYN
ncbi:MAG: hypothetical protein CSA15_00280, partial [Candidatus Delongbacteria bacterium]